MTFAFDLISDLHIETWPNFNWTGQATSPVCVVAGDVSDDHVLVKQTLTHLGKCYQLVLYIDGNDEQKYGMIDGETECHEDIKKLVNGIPNVVYLHDNVVVTNGVAILAANGWWTWDFDTTIELEQLHDWFCNGRVLKCKPFVPDRILDMAKSDVIYLYNSIKKLQTHPDVKRIVIVTHTVPGVDLIEHDLSLIGTYRYNIIGNSYMRDILTADTQNKIQHWCMGHYHSNIDQEINGVRYVNNCRGRGDSDYKKSVYYPKRIEVNF